MPSFDIVSDVDLQEVRNAVDQASREVNTRFDFKGTNSRFEQEKSTLTLFSESEFQLQQMQEILKNKLVKRGIALGTLKIEDPLSNLKESRQVITLLQGIDADLARKIIKIIKDRKLKVQTAIQGEQIRVTGKKRDDLQDVIACIREAKLTLPLQYINFRD
ncbi:MAG: YajQ family cyclic di-GMP-binding protein [Gammaproteobacteria bacterium]